MVRPTQGPNSTMTRYRLPCLIFPLLAAILLVRTGWGLSEVADVLRVAEFSSLSATDGIPEHWTEMTFPKIKRRTRYELVRDNGRTVLKAHSRAAASGLIRGMPIDPRRRPWLRWSWRIQNTLEKGDVTRKEGDDYPARIYVAFAFEAHKAGWWERLRYQAACLGAGRELPGTVLNYIWANQAPEGLMVDNPFAPQAKMVVVRSGSQQAGQWMAERLNMVEDYRKAFGRPPPAIIGVAVMTDTDNTGEEAVAYYGDIVMTAE